MEQHQQAADDWVRDAERWLCQIDGVRQCKIDVDRHGEIAAVHIVADKQREPRHIVRDVESLLKARLDLNVYYKKIGVVQVLEPEECQAVAGLAEAVSPRTADGAAAHLSGIGADPAPAGSPPRRERSAPGSAPGGSETRAQEPPPGENSPWQEPTWQGPRPVQPAVLVEAAPGARVECRGVGVMASGAVLTATVELAYGQRVVRAEQTGPAHPGIESQLLGRATITALSQMIRDPISLNLADVREVDLAGEQVVCVAVDLVEGRRSERFCGCCSRREATQQAPVLAVLDALNRRLALLELEEVPATP